MEWLTTELIFTVLNSIILACTFFYQKNKNKVLLDRVTQQKDLLTDTKNAMSQLNDAINGQGSVVESALKYSESFDIDKIRNAVSTELNAEFAKELQAAENNKKELIDKHQRLISQELAPLIDLSAKALAELPASKIEMLTKVAEGSTAKLITRQMLELTVKKETLERQIQNQNQPLKGLLTLTDDA